MIKTYELGHDKLLGFCYPCATSTEALLLFAEQSTGRKWRALKEIVATPCPDRPDCQHLTLVDASFPIHPAILEIIKKIGERINRFNEQVAKKDDLVSYLRLSIVDGKPVLSKIVLALGDIPEVPGVPSMVMSPKTKNTYPQTENFMLENGFLGVHLRDAMTDIHDHLVKRMREFYETEN